MDNVEKRLPSAASQRDSGRQLLGSRWLSFKYLAVLPFFFVLVVLTLQPAWMLLRLSISEVAFVEGQLEWSFVGARYLETLSEDPIAPTAIRNTLIFVAIVVPVETLVGLALALGVSRTGGMARIYKSVIVLPLLIPAVAIGTLWRLMYDYNYGVITQTLLWLGIENPPLWTADPSTALLSVIIVDVWHWSSFMFLIMLAGVQSIPPEPISAARVDGANEFQLHRHIIIPLMLPTIISAMMLRTIFAFKVFDQVFVLTDGGPGQSTQVISLYIYKVFSEQFRLGYAGFLALLMALIIGAIVFVFVRVNGLILRRMYS
jgi:multiple sugar transport system permease protein